MEGYADLVIDSPQSSLLMKRIGRYLARLSSQPKFRIRKMRSHSSPQTDVISPTRGPQVGNRRARDTDSNSLICASGGEFSLLKHGEICDLREAGQIFSTAFETLPPFF